MTHDERIEPGLPIGIGGEIRTRADGQQLDQPVACAIDAALDGADRAAADLRRFLLGPAPPETAVNDMTFLRVALR